MDFVITGDHRVKIKESEKINKYLDLARELNTCGKKKKENGFCHYGGPQSENKKKRKDKQILRPCQRTKYLWEMSVTVTPVVVRALVLYTMMRSISKVIHIHIHIQSNSNANTGRLCRFRYERFINFRLRFIDTRRETQFLLC